MICPISFVTLEIRHFYESVDKKKTEASIIGVRIENSKEELKRKLVFARAAVNEFQLLNLYYNTLRLFVCLFLFHPETANGLKF